MEKAKLYCKKHEGFKDVSTYTHKFDFELELLKLIAVLECGCEVWIASAENIEKIRTVSEVVARIRKLADLSVFPPEGVVLDSEMELHRWFCRGGISFGRWLLGEEMGDPPHEIDILKK